MKKIKTALLAASMIFTSTLEVNAACIPPSVAEGAVAGRTYILENSPNSKFPKYLRFGNASDLIAGYGSALDGHPGGIYRYRGNCHAEVIVTFTSAFGSNPGAVEVFHLRPLDHEYFKLQSNKKEIFNIAKE